MAQFISIPNTLSAASPFLFNVSTITGVLYATATTFVIYSSGKAYTFTVTGGTAALTSTLVNAINIAIFSTGPTLSTVAIPVGATLAGLPAIT